MNNNAFASASRREVQLTPQVISGAVPEGLHGVVFINSACGTVNTDGMPYPPNYPDGSSCQEYGSPLINGDGMLYRIDFSESGKVAVRNGLLRPPCYYADLATSERVNPGNPWADLKFNNLGLARISMKLGTRNELNTAITPVRFKNEGAHRLLATFDAGRPFEFDPEKLELITAIGRNTMTPSDAEQAYEPGGKRRVGRGLRHFLRVWKRCGSQFIDTNVVTGISDAGICVRRFHRQN